MTDTRGQPEQLATTEPLTTSDGAQTISVNTQQAAAQLGVDSRTVRRYISDGIHIPGGALLYLEARQVRTGRGPEWQIYQTDLEEFKKERDRQATEGNTAGQVARPAEESQALTTSIQIIATELERRSQALSQAQETIERLAHEAGRQAGRNEVLERELETLRARVAELELEREQRSPAPKRPRPIRLLRWRRED